MTPREPMKLNEILELMELKGWNQAELARRLELNPAAICRWFNGTHKPTGPARILLRLWLTEARNEVQKQPA